MNRLRVVENQDTYPDKEKQFRDMDKDSEDLVRVEGIHQGVILTDTWGNEWDDTDDFGELDFRTVDGI